MNKLFSKGFVLIISVILVFSGILNSCIFKDREDLSPLDAVPLTSSLVFKIKDFVELSESLKNKYPWWEIVSKYEVFDPIRNNVELFEMLSQKYPEFKKFSKGREVYGALNVVGKDEKDYLFIISMNSNSDKDYIESFIEKYIRDNKFVSKKRKYNKSNILEIYNSEKTDLKMVYTFTHNLLIFSYNSLLIEESLRQVELTSLIKDNDFASLKKTIDNKADLNLFINHGRANDLIKNYLSEYMVNKAELLNSEKRWTELDFTFKPEKIIVSGFSKGDEAGGYFSNILKGQKSGISKIEEVIPLSVPHFVKFYISDLKLFSEEIKNYRKNNNSLLKVENEIKDIEKRIGINIEEFFSEIFDKEVAVSGLATDQYLSDKRGAFYVKVKSGSYTYKKMLGIQELFFKAKKLPKDELQRQFVIDDQTKFMLHRCPIDNIPFLLFGRFFQSTKTNWFTVYNNYILFADSYESLCKILASNVLGETLLSDSGYSKFQSGLTTNNNFNFYCNVPVSITISEVFFKKDIADRIIRDNELKKFKNFAWQVSNSGNQIYNNAVITFDPNIDTKPKTVWQSRLSSPSVFRPQFVDNFQDPLNKDIVLQDNENIFYLINNVGRILWQLKLESPILGEIHQIDFFKNGKKQFVFNTSEKLYVIDRNGNDVGNFPLTFRAKAVNGVAVFDYEKNENYRFFIACEDHLIYAYDQEGALVEGWELFKTDHPVRFPLQHFVIEGKDYIIASDLMKDYILDRKGSIRINTDVVYQHSAKNKVYFEKRTSYHEPRIVTTDNEGRIHRTYFNGSHEVVEFNKFDDTHFFLASNVDDDEELEYIFVQKNQIYVQENIGRSLFTQKLDCNIDYLPGVYTFASNEKKIGVTCRSSNKMFLFNINGSLYNDFPLEGSSEFSIGLINEESSNFNLLTNSPDGYLYNYYIKK